MILSTANSERTEVTRLPDRIQGDRRISALQVHSSTQAQEVLEAHDLPGHVLYVDIERKSDVDLGRIASETVKHAQLVAVKPNDTTVDALDALTVHELGQIRRDVEVAVVGTGNLAFKFALRMAEHGAKVHLVGRDESKAEALCRAINLILPAHSPHGVRASKPAAPIRLLISAVSGANVVTEDWIPLLRQDAICVDAGIGNFSPGFVAMGLERGLKIHRLDVRSAGTSVPQHPNRFFLDTAGSTTIGGIAVVAGGILGRSGSVVVDSITAPSRVIGIADGHGGLVESVDAPEAIHSISVVRDALIKPLE